MKLRVRNNSVRFRLGQSEVAHLQDAGECRETIEFPGGARLEYVLTVSSAGEFEVSFEDGVILVSIPMHEMRPWQSPHSVGISAVIPLHSDKTLELLIEKDFRCLDEAITEDQSDTFENPLASLRTC
jgi:hypothetical protein